MGMVRKQKHSRRLTRGTTIPAIIVFLAACLPLKVNAEYVGVDLELVLAVDTSGSMSSADLLIQRQGYIAALRHADFAAALATRGAMAIAYVEWAGPNDQKVIVPWTIVSNRTSVEQFAESLAAAPLHSGFSSAPWETGTSISQALLFSARLFAAPYARHVIDISGNGPNNVGGSLGPARDWVLANGITVNGLPILRRIDGEFPLAAYYEDCVIGGPGAFAMPVGDPAGFATAVRRKMILEIARLPIALPILVDYTLPSPARVDCEQPEKVR